MDQPGPRHQILKPPLIERPDLQSPRQRTLYGALTLAFWMFWFYLWLPVLALLAWALGVQQAYKYMVVLGGYVEVLRVVGMYALIIFLLGGALLLWANYNIMRYGSVEKRKAVVPITPEQISLYFGQDLQSVLLWRTKQRLCVSHDESGRVVNVEVLANSAAIPSQ